VILSSSIGGIKISEIPKKYFQIFNKILNFETTSATNLSVFVRQLIRDGFVVEIPHIDDVATIADAMMMAGFVGTPTTESPSVIDLGACPSDDVPIGADGNVKVRSCQFDNYVNDLIEFKESIIDVVVNFCSKCSDTGGITGMVGKLPGLALSLFAAEWDRYHAVRNIVMPELRSLRERFFAVKLMPFLQSIPELEVVGTHPEVRVRPASSAIANGIATLSGRRNRIIPSPRNIDWSTSAATGGLKLTAAAGATGASRSSPPATPNISTNDGYASTQSRNRSTISLNSELFGSSSPTTPTTGVRRQMSAATPETQTRIVLEQMMSSTQSQILGILSHVPSDPIEAANAVTKVNELQVLVNAIKAALAVLPTPPPSPTAPTPRTTLSIDSLLRSSRPASSSANSSPQAVAPPPSSRMELKLDTMLDLPPAVSPPASPLSAAASAGTNVGPLLADLSRILFAQVIQQQQNISQPATVAETNKALERTLNDIVSAASSPPTSPVGSSPIGLGNLIIPNSLPTSPIHGRGTTVVATGHSTPLLGAPQTTNTTLSLSSALGIGDDAPTTAATSPQEMKNLSAPPGLIPQSRRSRISTVVTTAVMNSAPEKKIIGKSELLAILAKMIKTQNVQIPQELVGLTCKQAPPRVNRKTPHSLLADTEAASVILE
jgi:hypothetical protein